MSLSNVYFYSFIRRLKTKPKAMKGPKGIESLKFFILNNTRKIDIKAPEIVEKSITLNTDCNPKVSPNNPKSLISPPPNPPFEIKLIRNIMPKEKKKPRKLL